MENPEFEVASGQGDDGYTWIMRLKRTDHTILVRLRILDPAGQPVSESGTDEPPVSDARLIETSIGKTDGHPWGLIIRTVPRLTTIEVHEASRHVRTIPAILDMRVPEERYCAVLLPNARPPSILIARDALGREGARVDMSSMPDAWDRARLRRSSRPASSAAVPSISVHEGR